MFRTSSLIAASLLALAACNRNGEDDVAIDNGLENATNDLAGNEAAPAPAASEFAAAVAANDLYEIESGQLAADKASSADLKQFAAMLVADHKKSTADLKAAADLAEPSVAVTPVLDAEKRAMIDALDKASGPDFDRTFIDQQKQAHRKALDLLRQYEGSGDSQALKDFAAKASTVVQGHLDKLNEMRP